MGTSKVLLMVEVVLKDPDFKTKCLLVKCKVMSFYCQCVMSQHPKN